MKSNSSNLFVGITTFNSETLLPHCLKSLRRTAPHAKITILDNLSEDCTAKIASSFGIELIRMRSNQRDALNELVRISDRPYTLLLHADVIFLSSRWLELVLGKLSGETVLVSPEDVGCGPFTRPWGVGMPESSFMFFLTAALKKLRKFKVQRRGFIPRFIREFDFAGDHITYNIPQTLKRSHFTWFPMTVHTSNWRNEAFYEPNFALRSWHWRPEFGHLRYGLGNFYSIDKVVTHYHNWYDRRTHQMKAQKPESTLEEGGSGVPTEFLDQYTSRFIEDFSNEAIELPAGLSI